MVGIATTFAAVATAAMAVDPTVRFAFEGPGLRLALQVSTALVAMLLAYLIYGRFKRRPLLGDLALVYALSLLASTNLFFAIFPEPDLREGNLTFHTWVPVALRLVAAVAIGVAALLPDRAVRGIGQPGARILVTTSASLAALIGGGALLLHVLPAGTSVTEETAGAPNLTGHPVLLAAVGLTALVFAASAYGFTGRAERRPDPLTSALAVACSLGAFASACFVLYPSMDTAIIQSGDWLLLGFYVVLLLGAEREIDRYQSQLASMAVYEERRRLARELHDGVAQELAFVVNQTRLLMRGGAPAGTDGLVAAAAERALDESRRAITALSGDPDEPLHLAIAKAAEDVAGRVGVRVRVDASPRLRVPPSVREALVRIVRESVTNAARHGRATTVEVTLSDTGLLRIVDDGAGFVVEGAGKGRFGLVSMRERAERLNARFQIDSAPGRGTTIEVGLP
jgi:signal transduction histidine kinase